MSEPDEGSTRRGRPTATAVAIETLGATAVALSVSLRFDAPIVWLLVPIVLLMVRRESATDYGLDVRFRPPSWWTHFRLGAFLLLFYAALHAWFVTAFLGLTFVPRPFPDVSQLAIKLVAEVMAIAIPEEAFFRGYLQKRWDLALGRPWVVLGASVGPGLLVQSAVFATCHLATGDVTRLRVFFFALLAGWLRARSDSIAAPAAYHAVANIWYRLVAQSFR
jgi:membrane protease YdiL (CAAX protease family)